jgi:hypothetical protein
MTHIFQFIDRNDALLVVAMAFAGSLCIGAAVVVMATI